MNNPLEIYRQSGRDAVLLPLTTKNEDRLDFRSLLTALRRQMNVFLAVLAATVLLAVLLTISQPRVYSASAAVVIQPNEAVAPTERDTSAVEFTTSRTDTEVEIIRSGEMSNRVADSLIAQLPAGDLAALTRPPSLLKTVRTALFGAPKQAPASPRDQLISNLEEGVSVSRKDDTFSLLITFTTYRPDLAARVANSFAQQYALWQSRNKQNEDEHAVTLLGSRLNELRRQAQRDTEKVQQYRIATNLLSTSGASLTEQEISSYSQSVAATRAQVAEDSARLNTARAQMRGGSNGEDVGEALDSPVISALRQRQAEISGRLANLQSRYGTMHPDVQTAQHELEDINSEIQAEIHRVLSNLDAKTKVSAQRLASTSGSLSTAKQTLANNNRAMVGLSDLERRASASQALYESYLSRYEEVVARSGTERSNARIISEATPPKSAAAPKPLLNLFLALMLGSGLGVAAALITEAVFAGFTTGDDLQRKLNIAYLAGIPTVKSILPRARSAVDAIVEERTSGFAETFRGLRTEIARSGPRRPQVVVITSALPKEGKTNTALCLARTCAISGDKTVLIDCDTRRRGVNRMLRNAGKIPGFEDVMRGTATLDEALIEDRPSGCWILSTAAPSHDLTEVLLGEKMRTLISELRGRFDQIILDTPPILALDDASVLADLADAVVMVVRWRSTRDHAVRAALQGFQRRHANVIGGVLTQIDMKKQVKYAPGDRLYYYPHYASYYS